MATDSGYRPPEPAGTGSRTPLTVLIVVLLVLAVGAVVVIAGILLFRVLAAEDDDPSSRQPVPTSSASASATGPSRVELTEPLEIQVVTSATPGTCPAGSDGHTAPEPAECLELGGGFAVRELRAVSTGLSNNQQVVQMRFMAADREALATLTRKAVGERLALLHADEVIMAAQVTGPIEGGTLEITGNYTADEAEELATRIRGE